MRFIFVVLFLFSCGSEEKSDVTSNPIGVGVFSFTGDDGCSTSLSLEKDRYEFRKVCAEGHENHSGVFISKANIAYFGPDKSTCSDIEEFEATFDREADSLNLIFYKWEKETARPAVASKREIYKGALSLSTGEAVAIPEGSSPGCFNEVGVFVKQP